MPDILHKVGIKGVTPADVYNMLATIHGLSRWWTGDTSGDERLNGVIKFRFGANGFDMKVLELQPPARVLWQVIEGPEDWLDTRIGFEVKPNGEWTTILFKHEGWRAPTEFMHHCSTKWAVFLLNLKSILETGKGEPWPNEIKIDSWE